MSESCTEARFLHDVAQHKMIVLRDEGVNRHIRFTREGTINLRFDLITWPGHLCYTGDMGTFVFSHIEDMFEFFRTNLRDFNYRKDGLSINTGYWGEKLLAESRFGGYEEFDSAYFAKVIREYRLGWIKECRDQLTKEQRRELWDAVDDEVISRIDDGETQAQTAAYEFSCKVGRKTFQFDDLFDHRFTRATFHYIWCCYALAWGVQQYDNAKLTNEVAA